MRKWYIHWAKRIFISVIPRIKRSTCLPVSQPLQQIILHGQSMGACIITLVIMRVETGPSFDIGHPHVASKIRDLCSNARMESILFFAKRIPCSCLEDKYKQAKSTEKTGLCFCCTQLFKRRKELLLCSGCRVAQVSICIYETKSFAVSLAANMRLYIYPIHPWLLVVKTCKLLFSQYCSAECQRCDWVRKHKDLCRQYKDKLQTDA